MAGLATFRQRLQWTRGWLNDFRRTQNVAEDNLEVVEQQHDILSDHGIISLSDHHSTISWTDDDGQASCVCSQAAQEVEAASSDEETDSRCTWDKRCNIWERKFDCRSCSWSHCGCCGFPWPWCNQCFSWHPKWTPHDVDYYTNDCDAAFTTDTGIAYELAGREVENTFRDLRSASKARKRNRQASHKYYGWRALKTGQLDVLHLDMELHEAFRPLWKSILPSEAEIVTMTKDLMYRQAQLYPRPPTYHRRPNYKDAWPWSNSFERRQEAKKRPNIDLRDPWPLYYDCLFSASDFLDDCRDVWDDWHDRRIADECYPCEYVHWSRCRNWNVFEVDQVDQIDFEVVPKSRRNKKASWAIGFRQEVKDLPENRSRAALPYGRLDWIRRPEEGALCAEDVESWSEQPFKGAVTMEEWERSKKVT